MIGLKSMSSGVNVLMYHSISNEGGPTCTLPAVFREQLSILGDCGYRVISLNRLAKWLRGDCDLPPNCVAITFDDGFADFAEVALPELTSRGWTATVFLPAGKIGGTSDWQRGQTGVARPLMSWETVNAIHRNGIDLGSHGVNHFDLLSLPLDAARFEIKESSDMIRAATGCRVEAFAVPYGRSNRILQNEISKVYRTNFGTRLGGIRRGADLYNIPRIEMYYFRNLRIWREYLKGGANFYLACRRGLRGTRRVFEKVRSCA